jgi:undecaprenyl-diphosphatase
VTRVAVAAALAVAAHVALGLVTLHHHALGVDTAAFDVLEPLRGQEDIVRVLTEIGSYPAAVLIGLLGVIAAERRLGRGTAFAFALGLLAVILLVGATKGWWDRPRPATRFYDPRGSSFPSGHSAYAVVYLAAAMATGRRAFIICAAVVAVTIGASRLYLHVHYLTDVLGGYALGAAVFAPVLARNHR